MLWHSPESSWWIYHQLVLTLPITQAELPVVPISGSSTEYQPVTNILHCGKGCSEDNTRVEQRYGISGNISDCLSFYHFCCSSKGTTIMTSETWTIVREEAVASVAVVPQTMLKQGCVQEAIGDIQLPPQLPPLNNLPQWSRINTLDRARYPKPFLKDRLQPLPNNMMDGSVDGDMEDMSVEQTGEGKIILTWTLFQYKDCLSEYSNSRYHD